MNVSLLFNTIRYLRIRQILFQLLYRLNKVRSLIAYVQAFDNKQLNYPEFSDYLPVPNCATPEAKFTFLNQEVRFTDNINWSFSANGKLWNYNLHYGNYLLQENIPLDKRLFWLTDLHKALYEGQVDLEPYPVSIRIINTIRLLSLHKLNNQDILIALNAELNFLSRRLEYHLLANHLLENAFALLIGGAFFNNKKWINKGYHILNQELKEQVLPDGAHFELSPMYHQIMLYRILELIEWYEKWQGKQEKQVLFFRSVASKMLSWLSNITFKNGDIPHLNDSTNGIAYKSEELFSYANFLGIKYRNHVAIKESGYRKFNTDRYECVVDAAPIGSNYQPGHAHADALSFILYVNNKPVLVEAGTTTYENGVTRDYERSTMAHNTVVLNQVNQSDVWGGFRVGERATVTLAADSPNNLEAEHDGYWKRFGVRHERSFLFKTSEIKIIDNLEKKGVTDAVAYFHLHPDVMFRADKGRIELIGICNIHFMNAMHIEKATYNFSLGYNKSLPAIVLKVYFSKELETQIDFF